MRKSLFAKYFCLISGVIVVMFAAFGLMLVSFFNTSWRQEKLDLLVGNARSVAAINAPPQDDESALRRYQHTLDVIGDAIHGVVIIADTEGNIQMISKGGREAQTQDNVKLTMSFVGDCMTSALGGGNGYAWEESTLNKLYSVPHYSAGVALHNEYGIIKGVLVVSSPVGEVNQYTQELMRIFLLSVLIVLCVAFIVVYLLTLGMTRPLRQMAQAARAMATGDFSARVTTRRRDEVGQLAQSFNSMAVAMEALERSRRAFIGNVSHELKTPITTIAGFVEGILDGTIGADRRDEYLAIVSAETRRLSNVVTAMLRLSQLESGEVNLAVSCFTINGLIAQAALSFLHRIEEKQIDVDGMEDLPEVRISGDRELLFQVLYNFFENAVKFTPEKGTIAVAADVEKESVTIRIRNSGDGIAPKELPHLFERFYKTDKSRSRDKTGVGLGLHLCKTIIALHGGTVGADSRPGEYTEMQITLPI